MRFSKTVCYALLGFLIMLNIVMRYPFFPHEYGCDTPDQHTLANTISKYGCAKWVINPSSFFGLTPMSYSSGFLFILSGVSQCTGMSMESVILIISIFIGVLGALTSYLMAKEIKNDDFFAFIVAFSFSLSPIFLISTIWNASSRQLFVVLLPLFIWGMLRCRSETATRWGYVAFTVFLFIILLAIHHMTFLLPFIILAYLTSIIVYERGKKMMFSKKLITILPILCLIIFVLLLLPQLFRAGFYEEYYIWWKYRSGYFFEGTQWHILLMNMIVDYGSKFGPMIILGIIGFISILYRPKRVSKDIISMYRAKRSFNDIFMIFVILLFVPLASFGPYALYLFLPFMCILIGIGTRHLIDSWKSIRKWKNALRKLALPIVVAFLLISIGFSNFMVRHWVNMPGFYTTTWMTDKEYDTGLFAKEYLNENDTIMTNEYFIGIRTSAVSGTPYFTSIEPQVLVYGWVDKEQLKLRPSFISNLFKWERLYEYTAVEERVKNDYWQLQNGDIDSTLYTRTRYGINYAIENHKIVDVKFVQSMHETRYKIYDNGEHSVWYLGL